MFLLYYAGTSVLTAVLIWALVVRKRWTWLAILGAPGTALTLYLRSATAAPPPGELSVVRGRIDNKGLMWSGNSLGFQIEGVPYTLTYGDASPHFGEVSRAAQTGQDVTVWVSNRTLFGQPRWEIWRMDAGTKTIVSYEELRQARQSTSTALLVAACVLGAATLLGILVFIRRLRQHQGKE